MKAPDKLYIGDNQVQPNGFCGLAWTNPKDILEPMEYIRKEALLEWAKKKKQKLFESEPTDVAAGMNAAYDFVIDKLNSM